MENEPKNNTKQKQKESLSYCLLRDDTFLQDKFKLFTIRSFEKVFRAPYN